MILLLGISKKRQKKNTNYRSGNTLNHNCRGLYQVFANAWKYNHKEKDALFNNWTCSYFIYVINIGMRNPRLNLGKN